MKEVLEYLAPVPGEIAVDGTLGGGGHAAQIAARIAPQGILVGIDQDANALAAARTHLAAQESQARETLLLRGNFSQLDQLLLEANIPYVNVMLLDIGVSSHQIDEATRGFSFKQAGPLDMRMNQDQALTAEEIVNTYSLSDLTRIIQIFGEERWASRIAKFIVNYRADAPITNSEELVEIIKAAIPASARRSGGHPAKKTFQALRIEVNHELDVLEKGIESALRWLAPGGRLGVITFHSLEDRLVKRAFRDKCQPKKELPPDFPLNEEDVAGFEMVTRKAIKPSAEEVEQNARSRSAKLRVIRKKEV